MFSACAPFRGFTPETKRCGALGLRGLSTKERFPGFSLARIARRPDPQAHHQIITVLIGG